MIKNSKLNNMFKLSSKITVYVPSTCDIDKVVDTTEYVNKTAELLSNSFGGATSTEALGYWMSPTVGLVKEKSIMIFAYASDSDLSDNLDKVIEWCEIMRDELKQDCIALELNGEMYFI